MKIDFADTGSFDFSEKTNRSKRNLAAASTAIIAIYFFDVGISKFSLSQVTLENIDTFKVILLLFSISTYFLLAVAVRAFSEIGHYLLKLSERKGQIYIGNSAPVDMDLGDTFRRLDARLKKIETMEDSQKLLEEVKREFKEDVPFVVEASQVYMKNVKSLGVFDFSRVFFLELGIPLVLYLVATGIFIDCLMVN